MSRHGPPDRRTDESPTDGSAHPAALWGAAFERSPQPTAVLDRVECRTRMANIAFAELVHTPVPDLLGRVLPDVLPDTVAERVRPLLERLARTGGSAHVPEIAYARPTQDTEYWTFTIWPLPGRGRRVDSLSVHVVDVTEAVRERKRRRDLMVRLREANEHLLRAGIREQELAEEAHKHAQRMDALLRSVSIGVAILDGAGSIALMNDSGREILGLHGDGPVSPDAYRRLDLRRPDDTSSSAAESPFERASEGERFTNDEFDLARPDGGWLRIVFSGSGVRDPETGEITLSIVVFEDVTELRRLEEMRAEYTSLISHDLRAPLAAIVAFADLLVQELRRHGLGELAGRAGRIKGAARRMTGMIDDMVETARLDSGIFELEREPTDLGVLTTRLVEEIATPDEQRRIRVDVQPPLTKPQVDPRRLERAITNLITNALKYSPSGAPVRLRVESRDGEVVLSVTDRGPGVPPEQLPHLFRRHYRGEGQEHRAGLGLGLHIARLIAEAHGGRIWAASEPGEGSTFTIALPMG